ncbi:MAG TPA: FRG domain-containing protein [Methylocella sp.]|nr:FRG domain-containing protein [Methylocella sp.]
MPFAFWPTSPIIPRAWLDFLDFASAKADGTWLFRGHADQAWDLIPAIGRQPSNSAYRLADEKILFEDFVREAKHYLDAADFTEFEWLTVARHHGLPTRLLDWTTNPMLAAWFSTFEESVMADAAVIALRVPWGRRLKTAAVFDRQASAPQIVEVSPRVARITAQQGCFSLHPDPQSAWQPGPPEYDAAVFPIPGTEKADFRRLLHVFGYDSQRIYADLEGLSKTLAWRYRQR